MSKGISINCGSPTRKLSTTGLTRFAPEEALATPDHFMTAMEHWDAAHFKEHDAHSKVTEAREAYKDRLRETNYGI